MMKKYYHKANLFIDRFGKLCYGFITKRIQEVLVWPR